MAKNVLISGYIGFSNFGDDVIFSLLAKHLKARGFNVCALSKNPKLTEAEFKVESHPYKNFTEILKAIKKSDYVISGGGSLFQNKTSNLSLLYYIFIILLAKILGKKVIVFAQGIGPIYGAFWQNLTKFALKCADYITVRDKVSKDFLSCWKIKSELVADPAWDLPTVVETGEKYVGVQLRAWDLINSKFLEGLAKYIDIYFSDRKILILPLQYDQDINISHQFEQILKKQNPHIQVEIRTSRSIKDAVENFSHVDTLFAMRFHACLLGLKYGAKVMALSYDVKVENLAKEFELQCVDVEGNPSDMNETFRRFVHFKEHTDVTEKRKIRFNWTFIDEFMAD